MFLLSTDAVIRWFASAFAAALVIHTCTDAHGNSSKRHCLTNANCSKNYTCVFIKEEDCECQIPTQVPCPKRSSSNKKRSSSTSKLDVARRFIPPQICGSDILCLLAEETCVKDEKEGCVCRPRDQIPCVVPKPEREHDDAVGTAVVGMGLMLLLASVLSCCCIIICVLGAAIIVYLILNYQRRRRLNRYPVNHPM